MNNKLIVVSAIIGKDEKEVFTYMAEQFSISDSISKIPGFNTRITKACEEIGGIAIFNYSGNDLQLPTLETRVQSNHFSVLLPQSSSLLKKGVGVTFPIEEKLEDELEEFPVDEIEEDESEDDLTFNDLDVTPYSSKTETKDDDDDWV